MKSRSTIPKSYLYFIRIFSSFQQKFMCVCVSIRLQRRWEKEKKNDEKSNKKNVYTTYLRILYFFIEKWKKEGNFEIYIEK